jgi:hypothetical protein
LFRKEDSGLLPRLTETASQASDPVDGLLAFNRRQLVRMRGGALPQQFTQSLQQYQDALFRASLMRAGNTVVA